VAGQEARPSSQSKLELNGRTAAAAWPVTPVPDDSPGPTAAPLMGNDERYGHENRIES
jgi:hypothetical protein